jgi:putative NADH-flavin reductase
MAIRTVAVVGASGNIGSQATKALLDAGFTVTAVTRPDSKSTFPDNVQVRRADPASFEEVKAALEGQDAVIAAAAMNVAATGDGQDILIDAAVAAGVKRFLPSEYGNASERFPEGEILGKLLEGKARTLKYVKEKAEANPGFSWTAVGTTYFFDWVRASNTHLLSESGKLTHRRV